MVYIPNIPQGGDKPSQSRAQIEENFTQLNNQYGTTGDHVAFDAGTNNGKHKRSTYIAGADQATAALEGSVYTKDIGGGDTELFFRRESNGTIFQLTGNLISHGGNKFTVVTPWGLIFKWGEGSASNAGVVNSFVLAFPTACLGVILSPRFVGALSVGTGIPTVNDFTAYLQSGPGTQTIYYYAWGN